MSRLVSAIAIVPVIVGFCLASGTHGQEFDLPTPYDQPPSTAVPWIFEPPYSFPGFPSDLTDEQLAILEGWGFNWGDFGQGIYEGFKNCFSPTHTCEFEGVHSSGGAVSVQYGTRKICDCSVGLTCEWATEVSTDDE